MTVATSYAASTHIWLMRYLHRQFRKEISFLRHRFRHRLDTSIFQMNIEYKNEIIMIFSGTNNFFYLNFIQNDLICALKNYWSHRTCRLLFFTAAHIWQNELPPVRLLRWLSCSRASSSTIWSRITGGRLKCLNWNLLWFVSSFNGNLTSFSIRFRNEVLCSDLNLLHFHFVCKKCIQLVSRFAIEQMIFAYLICA